MNDIETAATRLKEGRLVAFPTETVYGLGGNALSDRAVAAIYATKGRPQFNPLIVHVRSLDHAAEYVVLDERATLLAQHFWPGALTMVLPRRPSCGLSLLVSAGLDSVAVRMPDHPVARKLLETSGLPLAAPSANRSGRISPTEAAHVERELGGHDVMILGGGACRVGLESTVIDLTGAKPAILRHGSVTAEMLEPVLGKLAAAPSIIKAPGMLASHYAPSKPLRMDASSVGQGEGLLAFGAPLAGASIVENLSETKNLQEAAANLFRMMRVLDDAAVSAIAVMPIPEEGLGMAINDRLRRAAHGTISYAQEEQKSN